MAATTVFEYSHNPDTIFASDGIPIPSFFQTQYFVCMKDQNKVHMYFELYVPTSTVLQANYLYTLWKNSDLPENLRPDRNRTPFANSIVLTDIGYQNPHTGLFIISHEINNAADDAFKYILPSPVQRYLFFDFTYYTAD